MGSLKAWGEREGMMRRVDWGVMGMNDEVSGVKMLEARTVHCTLGCVYKHRAELWAVT